MRYRIRQPWWKRLWMRLSKEQQIRVRSIGLSISVNVSALLFMGLCAISLPSSEPISLILGPCDSREITEDTITIEPQSEEEEQPEPEIEEAEPSATEAPDQSEAEAPPEDQSEPVEPAEGRASPEPSQLSDLRSDADRISEIERRVASAGGGLNGPIRVSLGFSGDDDLDLHLHYEGRGGQGRSSYPVRGHVFFRNPRCHWGKLDVDANANDITNYPAENIFFAKAPSKGKYSVQLHHFRRRGRVEPTPYVVIVKYGRLKKVFTGNIMPGQALDIFRFSYRHRT